MLMHRQRHPSELEPRFRRPVTPRVAHRLPVEQQALLEEALAQTRAAHQSVHEATAAISDAIAGQTAGGWMAARQQLSLVVAAAATARDLLTEHAKE